MRLEIAAPRGPRSAWLGLALLCLVPACRDEPLLGWIPVECSETARPAETILHRGRSGTTAYALAYGGEGVTLELTFSQGDWRRDAKHGYWFIPVPLRFPTDRRHMTLTTPEGPIAWEPVADMGSAEGKGYNHKKGALFLAGFSEPPESSTFACAVPLAPASNDRLRCGTFAGRGIDVLPGARSSAVLDVPPGAVLRFGTAWERLVDGLPDTEGIVLRVLLDGELLFERRESTVPGRGAWHSVALPPRGRKKARLEFEIEGELVHGVFFDPHLGPSSLGQPGARPWGENRPDIVVFLADTFRADNLSAGGGRAEVTPNLDALAEQGICFTHARSTAAWTLPAHASLFTGHYPNQVLPPHNSLDEAADTIAERLARAGYRTGAVTDGGFVSSHFELDQGFVYFVEMSRVDKDLPELLAEAQAFLAADDGRPVFLFVQTYQVHWPYEVSARARAEHAERLGLEAGLEADALLGRIADEAHALGATEVLALPPVPRLPGSPGMSRLVRALHALYLGGVADLDFELGGFLDHLRERGLLVTGYLVFTSDHGESFQEHDGLFHCLPPFEEQARIPLLVAGRGLARSRSAAPVSLIDLAPTLAEMAGVAPDPSWSGRSLLAPQGETPVRALYGQQGTHAPEDALFVLEGERKVLLARDEPEPRVLGAFDLARDPAEAHDEAAAGAAWPGELLARRAAELETILRPLFDSHPRAQREPEDPAKLEELRALGY